MICLRGGLIAEAMCSGSGGCVIKSLTVTKNGTYTAPAGIDGYSPVSVGVPDRYSEGYSDGYKNGYKDGYDDAKSIYEKIIEQMNGDGKTVTDDQGNTINNAIVTNSDDDIGKILEGMSFSSDDGSITVDGLTGADTYFRIDQVTSITSAGTTAKQLQLVLINKLTGESKVVSSTANISPVAGSNVVWKIESVAYSGANDRTSVKINVCPYIDGVENARFSKGLEGWVTNVGGTSFGGHNSETAITQS